MFPPARVDSSASSELMRLQARAVDRYRSCPSELMMEVMVGCDGDKGGTGERWIWMESSVAPGGIRASLVVKGSGVLSGLVRVTENPLVRN